MTRGRPNGQCIYLVLARYTRELIVVLGAKSTTQKQRTSLELVRDINTTTNGSGDTITIKHFPNKDILVVF